MYIILGADGKHYGPVTAGNVIEWMRDGRANLLTKARRADETDWKAIGDFPEFAPTHSTPPVPPTLDSNPSPSPIGFAGSKEGAPALNHTLPLAGLPRRFFAALIDGVLLWLCLLPTVIAMFSAMLAKMNGGTVMPTLEEQMQMVTVAIPKAYPFLLTLALVQAIMLCLRSQSVGKILLGLQIVSVREGLPAGPWRAYLLRSFLTFLFEKFVPVIIIAAIPVLTPLFPFLGLFYWLIDSFCIFREDQRCLHDLIAGTKVVKRQR